MSSKTNGTTAAAPAAAAASTTARLTEDKRDSLQLDNGGAVADPELAEEDGPPLPPDGGWGWVVVVASFFTNLIVDGVCYTFGIINVELQTTFEGATKAETALVGSLVPAVYLMVGPFVSILANRFGCRLITIIGSIIAATFFFISSFSNNIIMMMLTYGIMGGVGFGMMYLPSIVMVGYYFDKYRALATGIAVCGSGIGTFVFAPLGTYLVQEYAWRGCNIIISAIILHGIIFGCTFRPLRYKNPRRMPRSNIIEEIKREKARNRTVSGSSAHDGAMITNDNRMVLKTAAEIISEKDEEQTPDCIPTTVHDAPVINGQMNGSMQMASNQNLKGRKPSGPTLNVGSGISIRSATARSDVVNAFDRQDALYQGSLKNLKEYKIAGSHAEYVQSVQAINDDTGRWEQFKAKALAIFDFTLLRSLTFTVLCLSGVLVFIGLYTPFYYLQQKAEQLGESREAANRMILFLGIFNTISRIVTGAVADVKWIDSLVLHNVAAIIGGAATCVVPFLNSYIPLCVYAAVFGVTIAAFIALRSIVFVEMLGLKKLNNAFGLTSLFQGIAVLVGSPVSGALYDKTGSLTASFLVCGILIGLGGVICLPIRRIAAWENALETNFHEDKGFGSQYKKINEDNDGIQQPRV